MKQTPGAIGYVELAYARQNNLPVAAIRNASGEFVLPSIEGATAAAAGVTSSLPVDTDYRISIVNAAGKGAYPISSFTWILAYEKQTDAVKGKKLGRSRNFGLPPNSLRTKYSSVARMCPMWIPLSTRIASAWWNIGERRIVISSRR